MYWREGERTRLSAALVVSLLTISLSAVRGAHIPEHTPGVEEPTSGTDDSGGSSSDDTLATTVGFVVILFVLVLAILITVLLCVRHGMCSCQNKKPPPKHLPIITPSHSSRGTGAVGEGNRNNRSPLVSTSSLRSSQRGGGHSTQSPNSHHHHSHHHHSHHHHSHHSSPRRHNGHTTGGSSVANGNNSGTSIGGSSGFSNHHHQHMRSASMDPPLPNNISPYPGMPFPYQPCKSPVTVTTYGGNTSVGYSVHPQIPRTPTSASITTLSSLSTAHNHRGGAGGVGNGGVAAVGRTGRGDRERANGNSAGVRERRVPGEVQEILGREWRGEVAGRGGREGGSGSDHDHQQRRGGRGGRRGDGGESISRSGEESQRSPIHHQRQQVETQEYDGHPNSAASPLQLYSTQV